MNKVLYIAASVALCKREHHVPAPAGMVSKMRQFLGSPFTPWNASKPALSSGSATIAKPGKTAKNLAAPCDPSHKFP